MSKFSFILLLILIFFPKFFFPIILFISIIEFTLLDEIKIIFDLSFFAFFNKLNVPIKFVLKTLLMSFFETSTAASAQQSIIRSNFVSF